MLKQFVGGVLLGSLLTIAGGLLVGPNVTLSHVGSGNDADSGTHVSGRYQLRVEEKDGQTSYSVFDSEKGMVTVLTPDGKTVVVQADATGAPTP